LTYKNDDDEVGLVRLLQSFTFISAAKLKQHCNTTEGSSGQVKMPGIHHTASRTSMFTTNSKFYPKISPYSSNTGTVSAGIK
jgi:hypothetical protein